MNRSSTFLYGQLSRLMLIIVVSLLTQKLLLAQEKQTVQIKTFDQKLQVLKNIEISLNNKEYISIGNKGVAIVELNTHELPIKSIKIKDDKLEAASWNLSKGILEIIVRPKSYKVVHFVLRFSDGDPVPLTPISFKGLKDQFVTTNQHGEFDLTLSLHEKVTTDQFTIPDLPVKNISVSDQENVIVVNRPKVVEPVQEKKATAKDEFKDFDLAKLDSIQSLTVFYAVFKNISIGSLSEDAKMKIDAKFNQLIIQLGDSVSARHSTRKSSISDSSILKEDIRNLMSQSTLEGEALQTNRSEFETNIQIIANKLEKGISNLSEEERKNLLADLDLLEKLLIENESKFYQNQNDYREIINTIKERYFDIQNLETRLSASENERQEQERVFRQRLIIIGGIFIVVSVLIVLLISFSNRLRKQANDLKAANEEVKSINENLEGIVVQRTSLLEETNKELDTFLYRASHDLRSPVRSILGLCNISDHIPEAEYVSRVLSTTLEMDRMLKKLISISEISLESSNLGTISLAGAIVEIKNKLEEMIAASSVQFHVDCPGDMTIQTSPLLLQSILANLIENAVFYSVQKNPDHARVEIKAVMNGKNVELSVYDNGVGIPESSRPKLFNMFFVGNEKSKGSGLGLYTVHKCVEVLQGKIMVESEVGRYTKFRIILPRTRERA